MAQLSYPSLNEVQLRLDADEDSILSVVRGCSWWTKAEFEGQVPGSSQVTSVTLTTTRAMDTTLRRILQMSYGLTFPKDGGTGEHPVRESGATVLKKRSSSR